MNASCVKFPAGRAMAAKMQLSAHHESTCATGGRAGQAGLSLHNV